MKIKAKLTGVSAASFCKEVSIDFPGRSFRELSRYLMSEMDSEAKAICFGETGEIRSDILTIVNGIYVTGAQQANLDLKEGDLIELLVSSG